MAGEADKRLRELGITLPDPAPAVANYVPYVTAGAMAYIAGQLPLESGKVKFTGKVGADVTLEEAVAAARLTAINILAQARAAAGGALDRVRCVKIGGFVNATPEFVDHPKVLNGASDLLVAALGERGRHARFAVGASSLPLGAAVEIDAVFEIR